ncbi:hypothetical protein ES703_95564 [subsurface metagenome]
MLLGEMDTSNHGVIGAYLVSAPCRAETFPCDVSVSTRCNAACLGLCSLACGAGGLGYCV